MSRIVVLLELLVIVLMVIGLSNYIGREQAERRLVNKVCGRASALMMDYYRADLDRQTETDDAASACGILRMITHKDYYEITN